MRRIRIRRRHRPRRQTEVLTDAVPLDRARETRRRVRRRFDSVLSEIDEATREAA